MNAKQALSMAGVALDAIELLAKVVKVGGPADAVLSAVRATLDALQDGVAGKVSPQTVIAHLDILQHKLAEQDAAADADLASRFPK